VEVEFAGDRDPDRLRFHGLDSSEWQTKSPAWLPGFAYVIFWRLPDEVQLAC
jgi:hypothetical protein